jgi:hypothetical protein
MCLAAIAGSRNKSTVSKGASSLSSGKRHNFNMHTYFTEQAVRTPVQADKDVFLHVLAHIRELNLYRDANPLKDIPLADARKLEDLWVLKGAGS